MAAGARPFLAAAAALEAGVLPALPAAREDEAAEASGAFGRGLLLFAHEVLVKLNLSQTELILIIVGAVAVCLLCSGGAYCIGKRLARREIDEGAPECPSGHALRRRKAKLQDGSCEWCARRKDEGQWLWVCSRCRDGWLICEDCLPYLGQHSARTTVIEMGVVTGVSTVMGEQSFGEPSSVEDMAAGAFHRKREIEFVMHAPKKVDKKAQEGTVDFPDLMFTSMDEALNWLESKIRKLARQGECPDVPPMVWEQNMLIVDNCGDKYDCYDEVPELTQDMFPLLFWYCFTPEGCEEEERARNSKKLSRGVSKYGVPHAEEVLEEAKTRKTVVKTGTQMLKKMATRTKTLADISLPPAVRFNQDPFANMAQEKDAKKKRSAFAKRIARFFAKQQKTMRVNLRMDLMEVVDIDEITQEDLEREVFTSGQALGIPPPSTD